jgi:hypothetical protein
MARAEQRPAPEELAGSARAAGLDWSWDRHSVCVLEAGGAVVERFDVAHDAAGLREVVRHRVGQVGIERGDGPVVDTPACRRRGDHR